MIKLNLNVPTCWEDLSQKQLFYYFYLVSSGKYSLDEIKAMCLLRFAGVSVENDGQRYQLVVDKRKYNMHPRQIAEVLYTMDWLGNTPVYPVRIDMIQKRRARFDPFMRDLTLSNYTVLENLYQGYLHTKDNTLVEDMALILYGDKLKLTAPEVYAVFFWFTTLKNYLSDFFPNYFVPAPVSPNDDTDLAEIGRRLEKQQATQLRALTKGDITKEKQILNTSIWSAFAELDAQAEEYAKMEKQLKK